MFQNSRNIMFIIVHATLLYIKQYIFRLQEQQRCFKFPANSPYQVLQGQQKFAIKITKRRLCLLCAVTLAEKILKV